MPASVAVAMSGGVDSSVACLLLRRKGFDIIGLTMKLLPDNAAADGANRAPCCTLEMAEDARRICSEMGIPHYTVNLVSEFEEAVIEPFTASYSAGRTPNPCLACNKVMKFGHLLRKAREIGAAYVATGHYARAGKMVGGVWTDNTDLALAEHPEALSGRALLLRGVDISKDQSYALYSLTQDELSHAMFPLGGLTKKEVRRIAAEAGLVTAEKPESQEICFIPGSYRDFLENRGIESRPGPMVDTSGKVVGRHLGIAFYTVGQRRGLGVAGGKPLYVVDLDVANNTVVVGTKQEAYSSGCFVEELNLIAAPSLDEPVEGTCMVRYRGKESVAIMSRDGGDPASEPDRARIDFQSPQFAVTPGQAAVLYQGERVFGGGVIVARLP
ncbi:MAG: tRNA 2-thiouridine(34) synthase MnmA [Bacillota bacterium]